MLGGGDSSIPSTIGNACTEIDASYINMEGVLYAIKKSTLPCVMRASIANRLLRFEKNLFKVPDV